MISAHGDDGVVLVRIERAQGIAGGGMSLAKKGKEIRGQYRRRGGCSENAEAVHAVAWEHSAAERIAGRHATAAPGATAAQVPTNWRRCISGPENFIANIFQDIGGALDADFAGENGILIFDAEDAIVSDVHVGLQDGFPS